MSVQSLMTLPCLITSRAAGTIDEYGDTPVVTTGTEATRCHLERSTLTSTGTSETTVGSELTRTEAILYLPPSVTVTHESRVDVQGTTYEVVGEPDHVWDADQHQTSHIRCSVRVTR